MYSNALPGLGSRGDGNGGGRRDLTGIRLNAAFRLTASPLCCCCVGSHVMGRAVVGSRGEALPVPVFPVVTLLPLGCAQRNRGDRFPLPHDTCQIFSSFHAYWL